MALEIFRLVGSVFVDTDAADKSLKKTDANAGKLGQSLMNGIKKVGQFAAGVSATAAAAGAGIVALTENTREYRTEQGKLTTAFEMQNFSADQARSAYEAMNGVLGDSGQAVEAANHLAELVDCEKDLATWTGDILPGVYAKWGASLPLENLTEAANLAAKNGEVSSGLADALDWAGVSSEKFAEKLEKCRSEQERQALITGTLNKLYSESAAHYRETNAEVIAANKAQDKLNNATAQIADTLEPVVTKGKEFVAEILVKGSPYIQKLAEFIIPLLIAALEGLLDGTSAAVQWLQKVNAWLSKNKTAATLIAIAIGTLTAAIIAWNIAQNAATIATTAATAATTAFGVAMTIATSPITLIVVAIGALIAIIYLLVKNWDTVKKAGIDCWNWLKKTWIGVADWFGTKVTKPVGNFFSDLWKSIQKTFSHVTEWFRNTFSKAWKAVKDVFSTGGKIFDGIKSGIERVFTTTVNAIIRGINKVIAVPFNKLNNILNRLRNLSIMKLKPFSWIGSLSVPQIPQLYEGAVLERGQVGLLEGNGAEAVVPLHNNRKWVSAVAQDMDAAIGGGSGSQILAILMDILAAIEELAEMGIFLDKDRLVGELAKPMDRKLGQIQAKKARV